MTLTKHLALILTGALSLCITSSGFGHELYTAFIQTPIYDSLPQARYNVVWVNTYKETVYIKGAWIAGGAAGETEYKVDMWANLMREDGCIIMNYTWDRYQYPAGPAANPVFFQTGDYFAVNPGESVTLNTGTQAYPWRSGRNAQYWALLYFTVGEP